jgi:hypothetical protein
MASLRCSPLDVATAVIRSFLFMRRPPWLSVNTDGDDEKSGFV